MGVSREPVDTHGRGGDLDGARSALSVTVSLFHAERLFPSAGFAVVTHPDLY
jgi:hypothetical protein